MALAPGTRLGPFEIAAQIGAGGMGEVYRALDTNLGRQVAIKILPDTFAQDPDRLTRLEREAKTLAALNHPNIAQIYGFERADAGRALVMELVEGPTLAGRIGQGPVPLDEAVPIARQIAEALEAAHEQGIIHRDLKPANIKLRPDGTVKVLDFGLAKAMEPVVALSPGVSQSPTLTTPAMTQMGIILGTAAYMSPEQARGKSVDKRADIWAFGVVLYEMLTGDRLFEGETTVDVLAQVVSKEPDLQRVPEHLRRLLRRCLERDPNKRLRQISAEELLWDAPMTSVPRRSRLGLAISITAGGLAVALALVTWALWPKPEPDRPAQRFFIEAPPDSEFTNIFPGAAISPDGRLLVFIAQRKALPMLWLRPLDSLDARELPGTENANFPFWSADGKSVAFYSLSERRLKRIEALGGAPQTLCETQGFEGGTWSRQGAILFSSGRLIHQVAAAGGPCSAVTNVDPAGNERHTWPQFLPDGRMFLYVVRSSDANVKGVYAASLDHPEQRKKLVSTDTKALYAPPHDTRPGFLLWLRDRTLVAQRFDPASRKLEGDPIPVAEQIMIGGGVTQGMQASRAAFWVSENELLVYRSGGGGGRSLVRIGRDGTRLETVMTEERDGELAGGLRLSPDGTRLAVERVIANVSDLWVYELARRVWSKLTSTPGREGSPVWSSDGRQLAFAADRDGSIQIYRMNANGAGQDERLTDGRNFKLPLDWSQDGQYLIYAELSPQSQRDLLILPMGPNGLPGKPIPFLTTPADEVTARFSPDGKWIAYISNITGRPEAFIRAFPGGPPGEWPVSSGGASSVEWRGDGAELFYRQLSPGYGPAMMAQTIRFLPDRVAIGAAKTLFRNSFYFDTANVSKDGQRFLQFARAGETADARNPLTVVSNWQAGLK
jgi:eukaryotic-like serine/threonine-protein kinase